LRCSTAALLPSDKPPGMTKLPVPCHCSPEESYVDSPVCPIPRCASAWCMSAIRGFHAKLREVGVLLTSARWHIFRDRQHAGLGVAAQAACATTIASHCPKLRWQPPGKFSITLNAGFARRQSRPVTPATGEDGGSLHARAQNSFDGSAQGAARFTRRLHLCRHCPW